MTFINAVYKALSATFAAKEQESALEEQKKIEQYRESKEVVKTTNEILLMAAIIYPIFQLKAYSAETGIGHNYFYPQVCAAIMHHIQRFIMPKFLQFSE